MDATIGDPLLLASVERAFEKQPLPGFWEQVTPRAMFVSLLLSVVFGFVTLQIQMSAGVVPGLNMPISVLSFIFLKWFVSLLRTCGLPGSSPFTRQENLLVLTTVVTVGNLALTGKHAYNSPVFSPNMLLNYSYKWRKEKQTSEQLKAQIPNS